MDGILYPVSLVLLAILAFTFNQTNNTKLAIIMILVGVYLVYSHETGYTATDFKNEMVGKMDESVGTFTPSYEKNELKSSPTK